MRSVHYIWKLLFVVSISFIAKAQKNVSLLEPETQQLFVNPLPIPSVIDGRNGGSFTIPVTQFQQNLGLVDPVTKKPLLTTVWGYLGTYPGPTILAKKGTPVDVLWENKLIDKNRPLPHLLPVDVTIDWALSGIKNSDNNWDKKYGVPIVTHIHGGHTESASDGLPDAWFTPNFALTGPRFVKQTLHYDNDQEAATIWYHDHAMGITRLNVYCGLAGFYLITDENEKNLQVTNQLPAAPYDIGLAVQDKMFTSDGQLYYPSRPETGSSRKPTILPEFFGDFILVNGKVWPYLEVEPRQYRFRLLNGSDSRFYDFSLSTGQNFIQIGSDGGLLPAPVNLSQMIMGPGERRDVIIDFSSYSGQTIILKNSAKTPYPDGEPVEPVDATAQIMAFKVVKPFNSSYPVTTLPTTLRPPITRLQTTLPARKLILFESTDEYGRLKPMLGTFEEGVKGYSAPITENIQQGATEMWEIYNETPDAHPIHLHMVQMQLVNRQKFSASVDMESGTPSNVTFEGSPIPPNPEETGWKDTYAMYPHQVTRVIATFDRAGVYVWHCHILSHEDHEMMRPYQVIGNGATTTQKVSKATADIEQSFALKTIPNPFSNELTIQFNLKRESVITITVYDSKGGRIKQLYSGKRSAGLQQFTLDGTALSNGTYFCEVVAGQQRMLRKLVLQK